jgi:hypothetical protein
MYGIQSAAYSPYNTAMAGMTGLQAELQKNAVFGADLGVKRAQAGAQAGQLLLTGSDKAAQAQYQADSNAAQYSDYLAAQQAAINAMTPLQQAQAAAQAAAGGAGRTYDSANTQGNMMAQQAAQIPSAGYTNQPMPTNPANSIAGNMLTGIASQNNPWFGP